MNVRARARRGMLIASAAAVAVWLVVCTVVFGFPRTDAPGRTDATFFLASEGGQAALRDRPDLRVVAVVVSRPASVADQPPYAVCLEAGVECITPRPETTQGEAEAFARLARKRGWTSVTVVSQTSHVARIRILMGRCFSGSVHVVAIPEPGPVAWLAAFVYESGAMLKVALTPGCHDRLP